MVGRGVLRFKKGVCSKRVSGSVVLEAFSSRARFICTTVVQIGVALAVPLSCRTAVQRSPLDAAKYSTYFISALHTCAPGMAFFFHCAPGVGSRPQRRTGGGLWPPPVRSPCMFILFICGFVLPISYRNKNNHRLHNYLIFLLSSLQS